MMWEDVLPDVTQDQRDDLASRFRMHREELTAVAQVARNRHCWQWWPESSVGDLLEEACGAVTRKHTITLPP